MSTAPPDRERTISRASLMARTGLGLSIAVLGAAVLLLVVGFFEMMSQGLAGSTSECCAPPPAAPRMLPFIYATEIIAFVSIGLGIAGFVEQRKQRWPMPAGRSVSFGLLLGVAALGIAGFTHLLVR